MKAESIELIELLIYFDSQNKYKLVLKRNQSKIFEFKILINKKMKIFF